VTVRGFSGGCSPLPIRIVVLLLAELLYEKTL
jgi:hypothetical protein